MVLMRRLSIVALRRSWRCPNARCAFEFARVVLSFGVEGEAPLAGRRRVEVEVGGIARVDSVVCWGVGVDHSFVGRVSRAFKHRGV